MRWVWLEPTKLESSNGFILRPLFVKLRAFFYPPMRELVASIFSLILKGFKAEHRASSIISSAAV